MEDECDDARRTELETLEAIFPEMRRMTGDKDGFAFELDLPVEPASAVTVRFPATAEMSTDPTELTAQAIPAAQVEEDARQISHLPSLLLHMTLPHGYPAEAAPRVRLSTSPEWLPSESVATLERDGPVLWEEAGRDLVAFTYIDHLQRAAENVFGAVTDGGTLIIDSQHKLAILDYDTKARQAAFDRETFDCGICLDPKKGSECHKMLDCGHIFCLNCLRDFYNDAIQEGRLDTVRCLMPDCAKQRAKEQTAQQQLRKPKVAVSPSELLQIGLSEQMVKRYVSLKYKTELEADKTTIYCPRQWCSGAAKSKRHKKPSGLEYHDISEGEAEQDNGEAAQSSDTKTNAKNFSRADFLAVCEDCGFAFCSRCFQTWHGEFFICQARKENGELTEEEKASLEYISLHTSPCPTCSAPAQKTHGCNHMICSRCNSHFCYLCTAWLDPSNPYRHYNSAPGGKVTSCYMRLWELEEGDGDDVGLGFGGGRRPPAPANPVEIAEAQALDDMIAGDDVAGQVREEPHAGGNANAALDRGGRHVAVAREAPLVLRLMDDQPPPAAEARGHAAGPPLPPPPNAPRENHGANRGVARGGARDGGRGGLGRRGGRGRGAAQQPGRGGRQNRRGGVAGGGLRPALGHGILEEELLDIQGGGGGDEPLDEAQQAWVRRFVQMALLDAEDQVDGDSDDDDAANWMIR